MAHKHRQWGVDITQKAVDGSLLKNTASTKTPRVHVLRAVSAVGNSVAVVGLPQQGLLADCIWIII